MSARGRRLLRALGTAAIGAALVVATLALHLALVPPPAITAPGAGLALHAAALLPPLALLAAFSGPWPFRALSALLLATGWYWTASDLAGQIAEARGVPLLPGEAFDALFWHAPLSPILWALAVALYLWALARLNRAPARDLHQGAAGRRR